MIVNIFLLILKTWLLEKFIEIRESEKGAVVIYFDYFQTYKIDETREIHKKSADINYIITILSMQLTETRNSWSRRNSSEESENKTLSRTAHICLRKP